MTNRNLSFLRAVVVGLAFLCLGGLSSPVASRSLPAGRGRLPLVGPIVVTGRRSTTAAGLTEVQIDELLAALTHSR